jgi:serine/threonine protein kinase/tetratricopeptide (TPR) repeat protein
MEPLQFEVPDRFSIVRVLGEGATGRVFEVEDKVRRARFAAKRLRSERFTAADQIARFKDEFRALQRVAHPNLVRLYELISNAKGTYILMELIDGLNFVQYGRCDEDVPRLVGSGTASDEDSVGPSCCGGELSVARIRSMTPQLVNGLLALHAMGKIHCDIKPDNVLVTRDGRVVILDFGLTTEGTQVRLAKGRGTPAFMAPEQAEGIISEAADWYAAGTLLYFTLCGQLPFGASAQAKRSSRPLDPRLVNPAIPDDLALFVLRLLEPNPEARPTDREIAAMFELPFPRSLLGMSPPFFGRERELQELRESLEAGGSAGPRIVHIHGESGIGKTSLIRRFTKLAETSGVIVFRGSCYVEASVPYKGLDSVVDRLASDIEGLGVRPTDDERDALAAMFSVFGPRAEVQEQELDRRRARARAVGALRAILERLSAKALIVIAIDDFQWSDAESVEFLSDVVSSPPLERVLLILAYRGQHDAMGEVVRHARERLAPQREISLGPLEESAVCAMAANELEARELRHLVHESGGNAFFLSELLRARREVGRYDGLRLEEVIASRIAGLPEAQRAYLELVCVAGRPLDESILAKALGTSWMDMLEARSNLAAAYCIRGGESPTQTVAPYHDRIRDHVLGTMGAWTARRRHFALARAYEAAVVADPEVLALHYRAAGDEERALVYLQRAGDNAARVLAFEHAAELYRLAAELSPEEARHALRVKYAQALSNAGRAVEAAAAFAAALEQHPRDVNLLLSTGDEFLRAGEITRGLSFLNRVAESFGESIPQSVGGALVALLRSTLELAMRMRLRARMRTSSTDIDMDPKDRIRLDLYYSLAKRLGYVDLIRSALFQIRYASVALKVGSRHDVVRGFALVGAHLAHSSNGATRKMARWLLERAEEDTRDSDPFSVRVAIQLAWGMVGLADWQWQAAVRRFNRGVEITNEQGAYGLQWEFVYCESMALLAHWIEGDIAEIRRRIGAHSTATPEYLGIKVKEVLRLSAMLQIMDDRPDEARETVLRTMAAWPAESWCFQHHCSAIALGEIELYKRKAQVAWQQLAGAWKQSRRAGIFGVEYIYLSALMLRVRIALAGGRLRSARRDIRVLCRRRDAWARAIGDMFMASLLASSGSTEQAAALLSRSIPILEQHRLGLYAAAARYRFAQIQRNSAEQQRMLHEVSSRTIRNPRRLLDSFLPWPAWGEA